MNFTDFSFGKPVRIVMPTQLLFACLIVNSNEGEAVDIVDLQSGELKDNVHQVLGQSLYLALSEVFANEHNYFYFPNQDHKQYREHILMLPFPKETQHCFKKNQELDQSSIEETSDLVQPIIFVVRKLGFNNTKFENYKESSNEDHVLTQVEALNSALTNSSLITSINNNLSSYNVSFVIQSLNAGISPICISNQPNHTSGGGPGGLPVAPDPNRKLEEIQFDLPDAILHGKGENVAIAIIDTAYEFDQIPHTPSEFEPSMDNVWLNHDAFPGELGESDSSIPNYDFLIRDHGLFVSSLAKASAPNATIKLYQALDDYGVGSGESICAAFHRLAWDIKNTDETMHWVINMSLFFSVTGSEHEEFTRLKGKVADVLELDDLMKLLICAVEKIEGGTNRRILFVASAGNIKTPVLYLTASQIEPFTKFETKSSTSSEIDQKAIIQIRDSMASIDIASLVENIRRYRFALAPARYPQVVAVAASSDPVEAKLASYSKLAEETDSDRKWGILTFGGDLDKDENGHDIIVLNRFKKAHPTNGIVGLYLHNYPDPIEIDGETKINYSSNTTGLASWGGTSMSAPLVSGVFACILSSLNTKNKIQRKDDNQIVYSKNTKPELVLHNLLNNPNLSNPSEILGQIHLPLKVNSNKSPDTSTQ